VEARGMTYFSPVGVLAGGGGSVLYSLPHRIRVGVEVLGLGPTGARVGPGSLILGSPVAELELPLSPYSQVIVSAGWQVGVARLGGDTYAAVITGPAEVRPGPEPRRHHHQPGLLLR
jgi:hypothetical protein